MKKENGEKRKKSENNFQMKQKSYQNDEIEEINYKTSNPNNFSISRKTCIILSILILLALIGVIVGLTLGLKSDKKNSDALKIQ